ncbi:hypothetical protein RKD27_003122 [Streptomyces sp. SAI-126]
MPVRSRHREISADTWQGSPPPKTRVGAPPSTAGPATRGVHPGVENGHHSPTLTGARLPQGERPRAPALVLACSGRGARRSTPSAARTSPARGLGAEGRARVLAQAGRRQAPIRRRPAPPLSQARLRPAPADPAYFRSAVALSAPDVRVRVAPDRPMPLSPRHDACTCVSAVRALRRLPGGGRETVPLPPVNRTVRAAPGCHGRQPGAATAFSRTLGRRVRGGASRSVSLVHVGSLPRYGTG